MKIENIQLRSSRKVVIWDINAAFSTPISRITTLRDDEGRKGFTLIELLVVVLIIGILAAIALPQYQKAVEKSKAAQALILLKTIAQAHHAAYLRTGTYPERFEQLDIDLSAWTGTTRFWNTGKAVATKSNKEWSLQLIPNNYGSSIQIGRISGPYQGAGFYIDKEEYIVLCIERKASGVVFTKQPGDYCHKLFRATLIDDSAWTRLYQLP